MILVLSSFYVVYGTSFFLSGLWFYRYHNIKLSAVMLVFLRDPMAFQDCTCRL